MRQSVISLEELSIDYRIGHDWLEAVRNVDLRINPLQIHGLVGESGSGKSTIAMAMIHYLARNSRISAGRIIFDDTDLRSVSDKELKNIWGNRIGLVPQNTMDSLNPSLRISQQMTEVTRHHLGTTAAEAHQGAADALRHVQIADPERVLSRYPHQLSGGMVQRVMIAMALSTRPRLVILDEPTTALDVTTQAVILDLFRGLIKEEQAAALYVSHDLGTVAQLCDYVTVLYAGEVMESAPVEELFARPQHPYTAGLMACLPSSAAGNESRLTNIDGIAPGLGSRSSACVFADRCPLATAQCRSSKPPLEDTGDGRSVRCWRWQEMAAGTVSPFERSLRREVGTAPERALVLAATEVSKRFAEKRILGRLTGKAQEGVQALKQVSIEVKRRSTFGIVGESGSGKTTLARSILALTRADGGTLSLRDRPISLELSKRDLETLRNLRTVFQNPDDSLNPYRTVGQTIGRTIRKLSGTSQSRAEVRTKVGELLLAVGLSEDYYDRKPAYLSGGEKQRVAIARAFAPNPDLVIADEPTSSLDVSVQAVILNLLKDLRATEGASYMVISHDLEVVSYLADQIAVMYLGEIVEQGGRDSILSFPSHPYTEALLSAAPTPDPAVRHRPIALRGEVPSPRNRPSGCPFHTRCPRKIGDVCETEAPPVRVGQEGHRIRCHYPLEQLRELQEGGTESL
ncbi:MAG: dipeptide ABC transporter ATP-binding protein [Spirochaetes bacterium]|jgi:peptide/nickel transport system ATP-binding protein|nr:dipeptide ABC transporter ATP-binding protein [Spirochaetota bacterium]